MCVHVRVRVRVCVLGRNLPTHLIYSKKPGAWEAEMTFSRSQAAWGPVLCANIPLFTPCTAVALAL